MYNPSVPHTQFKDVDANVQRSVFMYVKQALIPNPLTTTPEANLVNLVLSILDCDQTTAAVIDSRGKLVGMVGVHDFFRKIIPHYVDMDQKLMNVMHEGYFEERFKRSQKITVGEVMVTEIDALAPDDALIRAVAMLVQKRRKTLPVVEGDRFIGLVTRRSVLRAVTEAAGES